MPMATRNTSVLPEVMAIAGPNGSGKTTVTALTDIKGVYINADDIKRATHCGDLEAAQQAERLREEFVSYSIFFDKYRENVAADVSTAVNDAYIENHNQPAGVKTYGLVVELVTAYLNETN